VKTLVRMACVVLCFVLVVPAIADAKVKRFPTQIYLVEADHESIIGALDSPLKGCLRDREVRLTDPGTGTAFDTTRTARDGRFSIGLDRIPAGISAFTVKAAPRWIGNRLCNRDMADVAIDFATLDGGATNGAFRGLLFSNVEACEPGRTISVYEISADPAFVGSTLTDASGAWTIAQAAGYYEARADPALVGGGDAFTYCPGVVSNAWTYEEPPEESL
jgi:hypothetical protein